MYYNPFRRSVWRELIEVLKVNTRFDGLMIIWSRFSWFSHQTPYGDNWTWLAVDRKCCEETPSPPSRPSPLKRVEKVAETGKGPLAGDSFTPLSLIKLMSCFCSHVFMSFRADHWPPHSWHYWYHGKTECFEKLLSVDKKKPNVSIYVLLSLR